mmetsp:Transcript_28932/g.52353  ORF Transcript_28932/g.52353 Transcript_28932/m.52353 type:complete len:114 (-) Transcript_28932:43-384(-)|eukprot:CAMPEP_0202498038 /NCGR_PEP_ID=MMETSP1361-20130828/24639_1 /ASSEMBLY_ACC=CAM_ASM_000849 /TAXON_ID=210615 /ORGANISM="Staurosira complex sp., Strain CCMP2646" /LENGTH=113 /DNA_ID=CAMNT_0049129797 /DNA_START=71 /DNA_END=412 /DNA_ORIENTATION=+
MTSNRNEDVMTRVRERQWIYLGPIIAAPIAHICVTLYRDAPPHQKKYLLGIGIVGSTVCTVGMRLYLMRHAGYAGGENTQMAQREKLVGAEEKREMENPSLKTIVSGAFRGFG